MEEKNIRTYWPLILVLFFILGFTSHMAYETSIFDIKSIMMNFMGFFFLAFAFFKLLDVPAFTMAYKKYDILAKNIPIWGYLYPFVELTFGFLLLHKIELFWTNIAIVVVLGISIIGVIQSVIQKQKIQCACLGTGFNLPMSQVTIIEDAVMIIMALAMLFL